MNDGVLREGTATSSKKSLAYIAADEIVECLLPVEFLPSHLAILSHTIQGCFPFCAS